MSENHALVLVEEAIEPARLNAAELQERVDAARRAGEQAPPGSEEASRAQRDLRRAEAFLAIANGAH
jgi:F0F1-type ATP synthase epsilon subunit